MFEALLTGQEKAAYADSAYKSDAHDQLLKTKGIQNNILYRAYRNTPLSDAQNSLIAMPVKSAVPLSEPLAY